jgi:hypothetical protein
MFGSMLHADATASVIRFAEEVAPALQETEAVFA